MQRQYSLLVAVLVAGIVSLACSSSTDPASGEFIIRVDSISGPNAVSGGIAAEQSLWGVVGSSGCTAFKELRTTRVAQRMDVTVIGLRLGGAPCFADSLPLKGVIVRIEPLILQDFQLVVHEPDGSTLVRRIYGE